MTAPAWLGSYNAVPPNYERITEDQFWQQFSGGESWERQGKWVTLVKKGHRLDHKHLTLFVFHDQTGVGFVERTENAHAAKPKVFFKTYACAHVYKERNVGKCLTEYSCIKCPYGYTQDSSG